MAPQPPVRPHRSLPEIRDYAERLHVIDPDCTEPVPVTRDEEFLIEADVISVGDRKFIGFGRRLFGHKLQVL